MNGYITKLEMLPVHMRDAMQRYIESGIEPGGFLRAVLENDLMHAVGKADEINRERLPDYAMYLYNYAPGQCHGNPERVYEWITRGGLYGVDK